MGKEASARSLCCVDEAGGRAALFVRARNAKVMRRIIRAAWLGQDAGDVSALENPAAVEEVRRAV